MSYFNIVSQIVASPSLLLGNYANQHNPNNDAYWADRDNHSNQCNPNNDEYWHSRNNDSDEDD